MAQIIIKKTDLENFRKKIRSICDSAVAKTFSQMGPLLLKESVLLTNKIATSDDFYNLKGKLVGEFGFTPEEVARLDEILNVIREQSPITEFIIKSNARIKQAILEWVDFKSLKEHPLAQHDLTKLNRQTGTFEITETVSWIEWLEEGKTIRGYQFFTPKGSFIKYSRSGEGLMRRKPGGVWLFEPTLLFHNIAKRYKNINLKQGFGLILKSNLRN